MHFMELHLTNTKSFNFLALLKTAFRRIASSSWANLERKVELSVPVLIEALKDEEDEVRWYSAWVLSRIGSEAKLAVPALIEALKDEQGEIRYLAAKTLESIDSEIEIPVSVLIEGLDDNEIYVRCFAARTLKRVTGKVNEKIYFHFRSNEVHPQS
jgi:HEAT repeat protein